MTTRPTPSRRHDIDALRALAFALLIVYHWAMLYVAGEDWGWHLKSPHVVEWLQLPMLAVNRWRMDLVFLVSGLSVSFLLRGTGIGRFLALRSWRLLLPLAFGCLVVIPVQPYVQGVANGLVAPGFVDFLLRYWSFATWPEGAFDGWEHGFTWNHLWYLAYLWVYTVVLALLLPIQRGRIGRWLHAAFTGLRGWRLLVLPAIPLVAWTLLLQSHFPRTGDLVSDWYQHAMYFTCFLYGYWLATDTGLWSELARLRKPALALAAAAGVGYLVPVALLESATPEVRAAIAIVRNLYVWLALCAILGWSRVLLDRPFRWLPWANTAVYPWYVLHQSLILLLAWWLIPLRLGPVAESALVLVGTVLGCWAMTAGVQRVRWLRPCFGLKTGHARARAPGMVAATSG